MSIAIYCKTGKQHLFDVFALVVLVSLAIIIFGIRANAVYFAGGENGVNTFNWAFYVGLAGAVFSGIGSGCYLWGAYRIKRWEDKHYARIPIKD